MGDRAFRQNNDQTENAVSALFYIMNKEMAKPEDEMNVELIEKCAESIPQINKEYAVSEEQTKAFVEKMMAVYHEKHKSVDEQPHNSPKITRKKLSKRLKIILISAAIVVLLSGLAVCSHFDIFSFFVNDSKDYLSWDDGKSEAVGNNDYVFKTDFDIFDSFDELINDKKISIKYPDNLPNSYNNVGITYYNLEQGDFITTTYTIGKKRYICFNIYMEKNEVEITDEQVIINGYLYYLTSYDDNIQAASLIDNNYYLISSNNKKELLHFLEKIR